MAIERDLILKETNDLEFRGPVVVHEENRVAFQTIAAGATVTGRLYNTANDATIVDLVGLLTADMAASDDEPQLSDEDELGFGVGDSVEVVQDSDLVLSTTIASLAPLTLTSGLDSIASKGAIIRRVKLATAGKYLSVDAVREWKIGDTLILTRDDFVRQSVTVDQVLPASRTRRCGLIRVGTAPTGAISSGRTITNQIGGDLTPVDFGTAQSPPVVGDPEVGFRSPIPPDHAGLVLGMRIRGETIATDTSDVVARHVEYATVKEKAA